MPSPALHPLEAKFIKLALLQKFLTPTQVQQGHEILARRAAEGVTEQSLEQILQGEGLLTEDECEQLWEVIARTGDTEIRDQLVDRIGTRPGDAPPEAKPERPKAAALAPIPKRIGGYQILEPIGRGGMGAVFRARQIAMEREVALKLLPPELASNAKYIRRFIREARSAGMLNHGNLVHVHDVGEADGHYYISMEYVEGRTVKQIIRREGRLSVLASLHIIEQVAAALECAHRQKIVHRDIKPDNIMLTPQGVAKLCDLGLAKFIEGGPMQDTDTQEGHTMGTPHYMSPEQARASGKVEARSDLYSLGATFYHMVTGRVPFDGPTPIDVLMKVTSELPVRPDRIEPLLPPPLTQLILRLLAKQPSERPASAEAVRVEVRQLRRDVEAGRVFVFDDAPRAVPRGRPIPGPAVLPGARAQRSSRLPWHWWACGLGGALLFLLAGFLVHAGRVAGTAAAPEYPYFELHRGASVNPGFEVSSGSPGLRGPVRSVADLENRTVPRNADTPSDPRGAGAYPAAATPHLDATTLKVWERRFEENPSSWPQMLATLEEFAPDLSKAPAADQLRWSAFKAKALEERDQAAKREWTQRQIGSEALARSGFFRRALALLETFPPLLRAAPFVPEASQAAVVRLQRLAREDQKLQAEELEGLAKDGLDLLACRGLERWERELNEDGAGLEDEGRKALANAAARVLADGERLKAEDRALEKVQDEVRKGVEEVLRLAASHDLAGARQMCEAKLRLSVTEAEQHAYAAELDRLALTQRLYAALALAITRQPGQIHERDFRPQVKLSGRLKALHADHFVLEIPAGEGELRLSRVTRDELRTLFKLVFLDARLSTDDPLGRAAYDLHDRADPAARVALMQEAELHDARAIQLLKKLVAAERHELRAQGRRLLARAEKYLVQGRLVASQELAGQALSVLGAMADPVAEARAQRILKLAVEARAVQSSWRGAYSALPRGRGQLETSASELADPDSEWDWQGLRPVRGSEGALLFGAETARATPPWTLAGPALLELEVQLPTLGKGALALSALATTRGVREEWSLRVESQAQGLAVALAFPGTLEPAWAPRPALGGYAAPSVAAPGSRLRALGGGQPGMGRPRRKHLHAVERGAAGGGQRAAPGNPRRRPAHSHARPSRASACG